MTTPQPHAEAILGDLLADICSERVLLACSAAKGIPGDVWAQGAEGHYAFLCGLSALLGLPVSDPGFMHCVEAARGHLEHETLCCPERILGEFGFPPPIGGDV